MKKGLKIIEGFYINMDCICHWSVSKNSMQLQTSGPEDCNAIDVAVEGSNDAFGGGNVVEINEFKRIEREISEYLGIK